MMVTSLVQPRPFPCKMVIASRQFLPTNTLLMFVSCGSDWITIWVLMRSRAWGDWTKKY